jgi:hypothetical protein
VVEKQVITIEGLSPDSIHPLHKVWIAEEPAPPSRRGRASPGRFRQRRRLDAEVRRHGASSAAEDRHPEGGDTGPRAHLGT